MLIGQRVCVFLACLLCAMPTVTVTDFKKLPDDEKLNAFKGLLKGSPLLSLMYN